MRPFPNCQHIDNYRRCRIHKPSWLITKFFPSWRPACILDREMPPRDGEWVCVDQLKNERPATPAPMPRKK